MTYIHIISAFIKIIAILSTESVGFSKILTGPHAVSDPSLRPHVDRAGILPKRFHGQNNKSLVLIGRLT
jgi:hypothetical protein